MKVYCECGDPVYWEIDRDDVVIVEPCKECIKENIQQAIGGSICTPIKE